MAEKSLFLCLIVRDTSGETLLDLGVIEAIDEYAARSIAHDRYTRHLWERGGKGVIPWAIESMETTAEEAAQLNNRNSGTEKK